MSPWWAQVPTLRNLRVPPEDREAAFTADLAKARTILK
jgi:hypothetical protein